MIRVIHQSRHDLCHCKSRLSGDEFLARWKNISRISVRPPLNVLSPGREVAQAMLNAHCGTPKTRGKPTSLEHLFHPFIGSITLILRLWRLAFVSVAKALACHWFSWGSHGNGIQNQRNVEIQWIQWINKSMAERSFIAGQQGRPLKMQPVKPLKTITWNDYPCSKLLGIGAEARRRSRSPQETDSLRGVSIKGHPHCWSPCWKLWINHQPSCWLQQLPSESYSMARLRSGNVLVLGSFNTEMPVWPAWHSEAESEVLAWLEPVSVFDYHQAWNPPPRCAESAICWKDVPGVAVPCCDPQDLVQSSQSISSWQFSI